MLIKLSEADRVLKELYLSVVKEHLDKKENPPTPTKKKIKKKGRKFAVWTSWGFNPETKTYEEECFISPARRRDKKHDGFNYVGRGGNEGAQFFISASLEDAIKTSGFNPKAIQFEKLRKKEIKEKDDFLSRCSWLYEKGLEIKE